MNQLNETSFNTPSDFVTAYNKHRLANKNSWYTAITTVNGKQVRIKSYGLHNQILTVDGIKHGGVYDLNVSKWKSEILNAINS